MIIAGLLFGVMQDRKEQLKKSRLGNVVMFLYKLPDETAANRRMAKELVERWSRPIFEQYRDTRCPSHIPWDHH